MASDKARYYNTIPGCICVRHSSQLSYGLCLVLLCVRGGPKSGSLGGTNSEHASALRHARSPSLICPAKNQQRHGSNQRRNNYGASPARGLTGPRTNVARRLRIAHRFNVRAQMSEVCARRLQTCARGIENAAPKLDRQAEHKCASCTGCAQ